VGTTVNSCGRSAAENSEGRTNGAAEVNVSAGMLTLVGDAYGFVVKTSSL